MKHDKLANDKSKWDPLSNSEAVTAERIELVYIRKQLNYMVRKRSSIREVNTNKIIWY
ncbi:MAG: hypothetical protein ACFFG0_57355 [Candidatus Thorarchaeota archaeon]